MTDPESISYGSIQDKKMMVSNLIFRINLLIKLVIVQPQPFIENFPIKTTHSRFPTAIFDYRFLMVLVQTHDVCDRRTGNPADGLCPGAPQLEPPRAPADAKDPSEAGSDWWQ